MTDEEKQLEYYRFVNASLKLRVETYRHELFIANHEIDYLKRRYFVEDTFTNDEHQQQRNFIDWFHEIYPKILIYAIPNEYLFRGITREFFNHEGGVAGIPDLHIPEFSLWIEMKRDSQSHPSLTQRRIHEKLISIGHTVIIGYGFEDAKNKMLDQFPPYLHYIQTNPDNSISLNKLKLGGDYESKRDGAPTNPDMVTGCSLELESISQKENGNITIKWVMEYLKKTPESYPYLTKIISRRQGSPNVIISQMIRRCGRFKRIKMGAYKLIQPGNLVMESVQSPTIHEAVVV